MLFTIYQLVQLYAYYICFFYFIQICSKGEEAMQELLTVKEVAGMLKVTRPSVYNLMKNYGLPSGYLVGHSRRFKLQDIQEWLNKNEIKGDII